MTIRNAIILGTGKLAALCAQDLKLRGLHVNVYDTNPKSSSFLTRLIQINQIPYNHLLKKELFEHLIQVNSPTLLISAVNPIIIPKIILEKQEYLAINLHQALLPAHPGRNAEAWAIFDQDQESGITWHLVTEEVDAGNILIQKSIQISETMTSLDLFKAQMQLAFDAYLAIIGDLLDGKTNTRRQLNSDTSHLHYSWEIPNSGYLDLNWSGKQISAFLRAMDYGPLEIFGKPRVIYNDKIYTWNKYHIQQHQIGSLNSYVNLVDNSILIQKDEFRIELLQIYMESIA